LVSDADQQTADYVRAFLDVCLDEKAVRGVMTWGLTDKHSWLKNDGRAMKFGAALVRPLPYDDAMKRKPLWDTIARAFDAAPVRSLPSRTGPVA
jgi:endo-1,4-beta-xylanase